MGAAEFKLTAPIKRGEDTIEVLELREPTAKDIKVLGFPITGRSVSTRQLFTTISSGWRLFLRLLWIRFRLLILLG